QWEEVTIEVNRNIGGIEIRFDCMKYYIYFDRYRHPRKAVSERELARDYENSPEKFLQAMCSLSTGAEIELCIGHVGVMRFSGEKELEEYLEKTGDEIAGFYECEGESRPYNF
ncbi:MAG: hypothetical protein R6X07_11740, partial [Desulfatiglandales bacterium]